MDGRGAHVTAIDIDTRFVDQLAFDSIEVRRVDIREDELPQAEFDLVHSRLVLACFDFFRLTFESLRGVMMDAGLLSAEEADAASARFGENVRLLTPMMMAGIGRRR